MSRVTGRALAAALFTIVVLAPRVAEAQRVVMVHEEPRHRLIYSSDDMRVLDVQIQPGDTTLFHTHDTPITYVTIGTSSTDSRSIMGEWNGTVPRNPPPGRIGAVRAVLGYAERPLTHRVTNVGSTLFRLIAVPSSRPGTEREGGAALPGEPQGDATRWFRYSSLSLSPGDETASYTAQAPLALVMIDDGRARVAREDGWSTSLEMAGEVAIVEAGASYRLANGGDSDARIVVVEVR